MGGELSTLSISSQDAEPSSTHVNTSPIDLNPDALSCHPGWNVLGDDLLTASLQHLRRVKSSYLDSISARQSSSAPVWFATEASVTTAPFSTVKNLLRIICFGGIDSVFFCAVIASVLWGANWPVFSIIFGEMMNAYNSDVSEVEDKVRTWVYVFFGLGGYCFLWSGLQVGLFLYFSARQGRRIREAYFSSLLHQEVPYFERVDVTAGSILTQLGSDVETMETAVGIRLGSFCSNVALFCIGIGVAFYFNARMTAIMLSLSPLLVVGTILLMKVISAYARGGSKGYELANGIATEAFRGIRIVKTFVQETKVLHWYNEYVLDAKSAGLKRCLFSGISWGIFNSGMYLFFAVSLWYGGQQILDNQLNFGDLFKVLFSAMFAIYGLGQAGNSLSDFSRGAAASQRVFELIDRASVIRDSGSMVLPSRNDGYSVEFENVEFFYPSRPDHRVLSGLHLKVCPGKSVALVGESGTGKTTTFALLERFFDPCSGVIRLDGYDIRDLTLSSLRGTIGIVTQEPAILNMSVACNISYGSPNATLEQIKQAAMDAFADEFISKLCDGYDTLVSTDTLSGGQKQRLAIARAFLQNPKLLLLDEATSALDSESEMYINTALNRLRDSNNRTVLLIAHRLSTIRSADYIAVFKDVDKRGKDARNEAVADGSIVVAEGGSEQCASHPMADSAMSDVIDERASHSTASHDSDPLARIENVLVPNMSVPSRCQAFTRLIRMSRSYSWFILGASSASVFGISYAGFGLVFGECTGIFAKSSSDLQRDLYQVPLMMTAIAVVCGISSFLSALAFGYFGEELNHRLRVSLLSRLLSYDLYFFDRFHPGTISAAVTQLPTMVFNGFGEKIGSLICAIVAILAGVVIALIYDYRMALVLVGALPLLLLSGVMQGALEAGFQKNEDDNGPFAKAAAVTTDVVVSIKTVVSCRQEAAEVIRFSRALDANSLIQNSRALVSGLLFGLSQCLDFCIQGLIFWFGGYEIAEMNASITSVTAAYMAIIMGSVAFGQGMQVLIEYLKAIRASMIIFGLMDSHKVVDVDSGVVPSPYMIHGDISFNDVSFAYPTRRSENVLDHCNLVIREGQLVGIVGLSGSGKSTIIALLLRLYETDRTAAITISENPIDVLSIRHFRRYFAVVSQHPVLFSKSIAENIAFSESLTTPIAMKRVEMAGMAANIHSFVMSLPDGYHSLLNNAALSGGQRQRLCIARAFYTHPSIVCFDEATSALDAENERLVQQAMEALMTGEGSRRRPTTIVIAHRLNTIRNCDMIHVMKSGQVVESGSHSQLLSLRGHYYRLVVDQIG